MIVTPAGRDPMLREMSASSTYVAQNGTARLHFGLGPGIASVHRVRVDFPASRRWIQRFDIASNQMIEIREDPGACGWLSGEILIGAIPLLVTLGGRRRTRWGGPRLHGF